MTKAIKNSIPRNIGPNVYVSMKASNTFIAVSSRRWVKVVGDEERVVVVDGNGVGAIVLDI